MIRGAASPRSASPIGPAPTRLPRIALPPAIAVLPCRRRAARDASAGGAEALDQPEAHDAGGPDQRDGDGEPVEVLLGHGRPAQARRRPAAEHVGQAPALALV